MEQLMERAARALLARRGRVLVVWALLCVVGAGFAAGLPGRIVSGGEAPASADSEKVARALADSPLPSLFLAVRLPADASPALTEQVVTKVADEAGDVDGVTRVSRLPDTPPVTEDGARVVVLNLSTTGGTDGAIKVAHELESHAEHLAPEGTDVYVGGFGAYRDQLTALSQHDLEQAERLGLPIVFLVLLLTFGSVWAAGLPLVIALSGLLMGLGAVGAASYVLPMSDFVTNSASMIGVALGVDYAMFLLQRVRELTRRGTSTDEAIVQAMRSTGTAVLWSAVTVLAAEATLLLVDSRSIRSAAFGMVMVTLFAGLTALVVAPVLISLFGRRVAVPRRHAAEGASTAGWRRWATRVTGRGALWLVVSSGLLVALALPALGLRDHVSISGASTLPAHASVRQAYEQAALRYGPTAMSPVTVLTDGPDAPLRQVLASSPDVVSVDAVPLGDGRSAVAVTTTHEPYSAANRDFVQMLRDRSDGDYLVGGETAASMDATRAMFDGLPRVGVALLVVVALVLLLALRSVFLPLKAVALVVVSLGASLGSLLLLTSTEWGARLIGASGPGDIHPIVPITIVAVTVALSTDYEVILISRMKEVFERTGDNRGAIVDGVEHTGGVITSAAAIMVAVFFGFAMADLAPLKQLGVGLAIAVVLDATVVRGVLVPAAMAVMGARNWWWPGRPVSLPVVPEPRPRHARLEEVAS
ncbi:MMPL family transporter [Nocardioides marmoribigeumensis]|uniref:RND superfamily putative drug exporter n=1 Tax=Nocardioides marmoribigeumensis TaxID=433649 RepID=A0ABU2BQS7_9ACTN|nr:MMPL family transporter [Nocardioides marmoribigeumensis]MDR7360621.1 RND superfamily putative drug exporter [Nocardioides marmoribigeumensis]